MNSDTLETLYISKLRDLYSTEEQLLRALSKMPNEASSEELRDAFENNLEQIKRHVERLEQILNPLAESVVNLEALNGGAISRGECKSIPRTSETGTLGLANRILNQAEDISPATFFASTTTATQCAKPTLSPRA
jgi:hypothetical protein